MMNAIGNLGGFVSPFIVGVLKDWTGGDRAALLFLAACLATTSVAVYAYAGRRPEGRLSPSAAGSADTSSAGR